MTRALLVLVLLIGNSAPGWHWMSAGTDLLSAVSKAGSVWDPDGKPANSEAGNPWDPNGSHTDSDAGSVWDPNG
jgi:hypothetical protein